MMLTENLPLTIGIVNSISDKDAILNCLNSIKHLQCKKVLISTNELNNVGDLEEEFDLTVIQTTSETSLQILSNRLIEYIKNDFKNDWVLIINPCENITTDSSKYAFKELYYKGAFYETIPNNIEDIASLNQKESSKFYIPISLCYLSNTEIITDLSTYDSTYKNSLYYFIKANSFFIQEEFYRAITLYLQSLTKYDKETSKEMTEKQIITLILNLIVSYINIDNYDEASRIADYYINEFPEFASLYLLSGLCKEHLNLPAKEYLTKYYSLKGNSKYPLLTLENLI